LIAIDDAATEEEHRADAEKLQTQVAKYGRQYDAEKQAVTDYDFAILEARRAIFDLRVFLGELDAAEGEDFLEDEPAVRDAEEEQEDRFAEYGPVHGVDVMGALQEPAVDGEQAPAVEAAPAA
jgi:hypothetical protein